MNVFLCFLSHESNNVLQNRHFPLSIGLISEYLKLNIEEIETSLFKRPSLLSRKLNSVEPDIVMFGNYMWNEKLNCFFAQCIKSMYPKTLIVFGGPNLSMNLDKNIEFLKENKFIDILIEGDAEIVAKNIVSSYMEADRDIEETKRLNLENTLSISMHSNEVNKGELIEARMGVGDVSLDHIPSPYLSKAMDVFFEDAAIPLLESNRGCPYSCTFCQQGTKYFSKIRYYDDQRIKNELEYIAKKTKNDDIDMKIVEFADPNFGMYKNDTEIFQHIRYVQDTYDYPTDVWCSSGKSQPELIISNAKILKEGSIMIRAAVQSTNESTLKNIARKNLPIDVFHKMSSEGVDTYSDIMLGLPSETKESYFKGIYDLIDSNINEFSMPQTILLKGTPMEEASYIEKYGLKTKYRVIPECDGLYKVGDISSRVTETEEIVYSTNTLTFDEYIDCRKLNLLVMIFHNTRLLNPIYTYLDHLGIRRSKVLFNIIMDISNNEDGLNTLLDDFIKDTIDELSDEDLFFDIEDNIEQRSSNKIYKYLTIALFYHKVEILSLINKSLSEIIENESDVDNLVSLIEASIMDDFSVSDNEQEILLNEELRKIMRGDTARISYSSLQINKINTLNKLYQNKEDVESKLAYHLRPINMIKTLRFV
jgi:radical SAM superfamily enzyme YgiQ (UPF0313 family)